MSYKGNYWYDFEEVKRNLIKLSNELKRIPTKEEIIKCEYLPSIETVRKLFERNIEIKYIEYLESLGFKPKRQQRKNIDMTYEELCQLWENYYIINNKYPNSTICNNDKSLPSWTKVKTICNTRFFEFCDKYNLNRELTIKDYDYYCNEIIKLSKKLKRTPTKVELENLIPDIPKRDWLIVNCPNKTVKDYNDFVQYLGLKPYYNMNKEIATKLILDKVKLLNRNLMYDDFRNPSHNDIGIASINNIWGTFNNMLEDLSLPINQENMISKQKSLDELKKDIDKLGNHLYRKNGHKFISYQDIDDCEWCLDSQTYNKYFKLELNMTLGEYIESVGYETNNIGMGMVYEFENGEVTKSKFEYEFSLFLRNNNIAYTRNIPYKDFVKGYNGNKDCDYSIELYGEKYYIELAGMLRDYKSIEHAKKYKLNKIHKRYLNNLIEKEKMLIDSHVNYLILFNSDLYKVEDIFNKIKQNAS